MFFFSGIFARASFATVVAVGTIAAIFAWFASGTWRSALASTARADFGVSLPFGYTHESAERCFGAFARASSVALMDIQHFFPHITRTRFAEFHFSLYAGLQRLDIVEDQREGQQAGGDCDRAEDHSDESDDSQRWIWIHFGFFHLFVFTHCFCQSWHRICPFLRIE
jgi:hypothetical protein